MSNQNSRPAKKHAMITASFIVSIIALCLSWIPILNMVMSVLTGVFCLIALIFFLRTKAGKSMFIASAVITVAAIFFSVKVNLAAGEALIDGAKELEKQMEEDLDKMKKQQYNW